MKFAFYSVEGTSLALQKRVLDEGHDVLVYQKKPDQKIGVGVVPRTNNYEEWVSWGRGGVFVFDSTGMGMAAEALRRSGQMVVGGGRLCDQLEDDRPFGTSIARKVTLHIPKTWNVGSIREAISFLKGRKDGGYYFKPGKGLGGGASTCGADNPEELIRKLEGLARSVGDGRDGIIQEKIPGVAVSTARWWNGRFWIGPVEHTIERKKLGNDEKGPSTGCACNVVWYQHESDLARALKFDELGQELAKLKAPPGIYDINAQISEEDGEAYFLEWTPRFGYDSETTGQRGVRDYAALLYTLASGGLAPGGIFDVGPFYGSVRLGVPPYPYEDYQHLDQAKTSYGVEVYGTDGIWARHFIGYHVAFEENMGLHVASKSGMVGLALGVGHYPEQALQDAYRWLDNGGLEVKDLFYRTDAAKILGTDYRKMQSLGYD